LQNTPLKKFENKAIPENFEFSKNRKFSRHFFEPRKFPGKIPPENREIQEIFTIIFADRNELFSS
jgi:hypothetical protein